MTREQKLMELKAKVDKGDAPAHEYQRLVDLYAKLDAKKAKYKEALKAVADYVIENSGDETLIAQAKLISPVFRTSPVRTTSKAVIAELIQKEETLNEDDLWNNYKLGRAEMRKIIAQLIKYTEPENRLWISFDPTSGNYKLVASGPNVPKGWTGYKPVDIKELEITEEDVAPAENEIDI